MAIQQNTGFRQVEGDLEVVPSVDQARTAFDQVTSDLTNLYQTMLQRSPDAGGLQYWVDQVNNGKASLDDVSNSFKNTDEYIISALKTGQQVTIPSVSDFINRNSNDPQAVQLAAKQYGLDLPAISKALNLSTSETQDYFRAAGVPLGTMLTGTVQRTFGDTGNIRQLDKGEDVTTEQVVGSQGNQLVVQQYDAYGVPTSTRLATPNPSDAQGWLQALGVVGGAIGASNLLGGLGATAGSTAAATGASDLAVAGVEGAASQAATTAYTQTLAATGNSALAAVAADVASGSVAAGLPVVDAIAAGVTTAADAAATGAVTSTGNVVGGGGTITPGVTGTAGGLLSGTPSVGLTSSGLDTMSAVDATPTGLDTTPSAGTVEVSSTRLPTDVVSTIPPEVIAGGLGAGTLATLNTTGQGAVQDVINNTVPNVATDTSSLFSGLGAGLGSIGTGIAQGLGTGLGQIASSLLTGITSGNQANVLGQLINAGVGYAQAKQAADALLASGQLSQQQYNQLASNLQTGYQGIQGQYNQLGQNVRDTYTTLGDTYANQMDLLGGRYAGLGQGIAANLGGLGSNLQGQYNQLGQQFSGMAGDVRTTYNQFADEAARNVGKFTPYGVTSNLFGQPGTDLQNAALRASQQSFEQAGLTNVDQLSQDYYNKLSALSSPEQQRQRLATEERLRAQGRLGVSGSAYGGTSPELLAQEQAIAQQQLQRELQSRQAALGERGTLLSQGTAALQPAVQLGQFGSQAAQQQFANDLARQQYLTGLQTQGLQNEIALRTKAGQLAQQGIGTYGNLQQQGLLNQLALEQAGLGVSQQGLTNRANILGQGISSQANLAGRGIGAAEQGLVGSTALQRQGLQDLLARQLQATAARSGANQQLAQGLLGGSGGSNALGGVVGSALGNLFNPNAAGNINSLGFGTGLGYGNQDIGLFI
jgi:hypothetical protein